MNPGYDFGRRTWAGANVSGKPLDDNNRRYRTLSSFKTYNISLHLLFQSVQIAVVSQQTSTRYNLHFVCQTCCSCCCCLQDHFNPRSGSQPTNSCTEQSQSFREQGGLQIRKIINFYNFLQLYRSMADLYRDLNVKQNESIY